ncbi:MAG: Mth938-like domain-containing protein [Candidatus Methanospirareceae archaeon]
MINSYDFGRIVIDGTVFATDVIIFPDRVEDNWWRRDGHILHVADIESVVEEKPEVLIVGTGKYGIMKVLSQTREYIESKGIELIVEPTEKACEIYNRISQAKKVVAALHLTC